MLLTLNPSETTPLCKIKRVYRAFRSVSTPRRTKDLRVVGPVDRQRPLGASERRESASEWIAEALTARLRTELISRGWIRLDRAAAAQRNTVEQLVRTSLSERA